MRCSGLKRLRRSSWGYGGRLSGQGAAPRRSPPNMVSTWRISTRHWLCYYDHQAESDRTIRQQEDFVATLRRCTPSGPAEQRLIAVHS